MRCLLIALVVVFLSAFGNEVAQAQSSNRGYAGSGTRSAPRMNPARVAPVRSGFGGQPRVPAAAGILNSVRSAPRTTGVGPGSMIRRPSLPTTGLRRRPQPVFAGSAGIPNAVSAGSRATAPRTRSASGSTRSTKKPTTSLPPGYRTWVDATGRYSVQGKLAARQDGLVWIRRTDGRLVKLPLSQLSQPDQQFLSSSS